MDLHRRAAPLGRAGKAARAHEIAELVGDPAALRHDHLAGVDARQHVARNLPGAGVVDAAGDGEHRPLRRGGGSDRRRPHDRREKAEHAGKGLARRSGDVLQYGAERSQRSGPRGALLRRRHRRLARGDRRHEAGVLRELHRIILDRFQRPVEEELDDVRGQVGQHILQRVRPGQRSRQQALHLRVEGVVDRIARVLPGLRGLLGGLQLRLLHLLGVVRLQRREFVENSLALLRAQTVKRQFLIEDVGLVLQFVLQGVQSKLELLAFGDLLLSVLGIEERDLLPCRVFREPDLFLRLLHRDGAHVGGDPADALPGVVHRCNLSLRGVRRRSLHRCAERLRLVRRQGL